MGTLLERWQWVLLALLALLTLGAWALTISQAQSMDMPMGIVAREAASKAPDGMGGAAMDSPATTDMQGMTASGTDGMADTTLSWSGFAAFVVIWAVMMAAMMFPAAAPMLLFFQRLSVQRGARGGGLLSTAIFATGYLAVWTAAGAATWAIIQLGSDVAGSLDAAQRHTLAPLALGATLVLAGVYQFTPLKNVCLRHCQSPVGFVMTHWRNGYAGALRMGLVHGAYCFGCCWALFAVLVAVGVMSLAWMFLLTLVVFAEKVLPLGHHAPQAVGVAFALLGVLVATGLVAMPGVA
jgi:predicted metal-binding membrane protein